MGLSKIVQLAPPKLQEVGDDPKQGSNQAKIGQETDFDLRLLDGFLDDFDDDAESSLVQEMFTKLGGVFYIWSPKGLNKKFFVKQMLHGKEEYEIGCLLAERKIPNVVTPLRFFEQGDQHFLVFEYLKQRPLGKLATQKNRPPQIFGQALTAIHVLKGMRSFYEFLNAVDPKIPLSEHHPVHLLHRDLHEKQVLFVELDNEISVKVCDFGNADLMIYAGKSVKRIDNPAVDETRVVMTYFKKLVNLLDDADLLALTNVLSSEASYQRCLILIADEINRRTA